MEIHAKQNNVILIHLICTIKFRLGNRAEVFIYIYSEIFIPVAEILGGKPGLSAPNQPMATLSYEHTEFKNFQSHLEWVFC